MNTFHPTQDTITLKPRRVYQCKSCKSDTSKGRMMERKDVWKDAFGKYHCSFCGSEVVDKTNTTTGHDFMELTLI